MRGLLLVVALIGCGSSDREAKSAAAHKDAWKQAEAAERERDEAQATAIRSAPKVPEPGDMAADARAVCASQQGQFVGGARLGCKVGGVTIFACSADDSARINRCDGYYEGADLATMRLEVEQKLGGPTGQSTSPEGDPILSWSLNGRVVSLTPYPKGVKKSVGVQAP